MRTAIVIATLTIVAALVADGVGALLGAAIGPDASGARAPRASLPPRPDRGAMACAILAENVLDSSSGPIACEGPDTARGGGEVIAATPAACPRDLRLVGTYVEREGARIAIIRDATGTTLLYAPGTSIGDTLVASIAPEHVALGPEEAGCTLALFDHEVQEIAGPPPAPREPVRVGSDRVEVGAGFVARAIADPAGVLGAIRAFPARDGIRLAGIGPDHPLAALGVRSGDTLRSIDGVALDGPDAWLGALGAIQRAGTHSVELARGGRAIAVTLDVHP